MLVLSLELKKKQGVPCSGSTMNRTPMPRGKPSSVNVYLQFTWICIHRKIINTTLQTHLSTRIIHHPRAIYNKTPKITITTPTTRIENRNPNSSTKHSSLIYPNQPVATITNPVAVADAVVANCAVSNVLEKRRRRRC